MEDWQKEALDTIARALINPGRYSVEDLMQLLAHIRVATRGIKNGYVHVSDQELLFIRNITGEYEE